MKATLIKSHREKENIKIKINADYLRVLIYLQKIYIKIKEEPWKYGQFGLQ